VFPFAARWYLAAIAVVGLLGIAMQLSIQAHAQKQAAKLIHAWGDRAHVDIGDVRYHLLRNGLILQDIHIERGDDAINIGQMLLRANPKLLTSDAPRIGTIDISGLKVEITHIGDPDIWSFDRYLKQDRHLKQIWQAATSLTVHNGDIKLYLHDKGTPPIELSGISVRQHLQYAMRRITGSAQMQQGRVSWQWDMAARPGSLVPQQAEQWLSKGWLKWQGLDAGKLAAAMGLKQMVGNLSTGHLRGGLGWSTSSQGSEPLSSLNIRGDMQFETGAGRVQYIATADGGRWQVDVDAAAWPLGPWSDSLPEIGERRLISARIDGKMHWQGHPGNWNISSDQGFLHDVTYAHPDSDGSPAWYWSRINYKHAAIQTAKHQLKLAEVDMLDSRLVLQTKRVDVAIRALDKQADDADAELVSAQQGHAVEAGDAEKDAVWNINADKVNVQNMVLALAMPQGKVTLESLDGRVSCRQGEALKFKLHTHEENSADNSTKPAGEEKGKDQPHWQLRGKAEKNSRGQLVSAKIRLQGRHIPVARLRPLLPLQDDAERPVKLSGDTELKAGITVDHGEWQMQGRASVRELNLAHGGDVIQADQISLRFGPVGMGVEAQVIDSIDTQGWQYIAALHPLALHVAEQTDNEGASQSGAAWWVTTMRNNHIAITRLNLENGQISVGQEQALWADKVNIEAANIQSDQWSDIAVTAEVGGSAFYLKGRWQALSDVQRFRGDAGLNQAEPFFLHNWMAASGIPRLIQGRLSASLQLDDGQEPDSYQGKVKLQLLQGLTETGVFTADPMLSRTGYSAPELLQRLEQSPGVIALQYDVNGLWNSQPFTLERFGLSMLTAVHDVAQSGSWREDAAEKNSADAAIEARIRLHGRERLSLNERNRLSVVVRKLRQHPEMMIVLRPKWTGAVLTEEMKQRIRRTSQLIEKYMTHRKIDKRRIFPLWPTADDQVDEIGSVQVETKITG